MHPCDSWKKEIKKKKIKINHNSREKSTIAFFVICETSKIHTSRTRIPRHMLQKKITIQGNICTRISDRVPTRGTNASSLRPTFKKQTNKQTQTTTTTNPKQDDFHSYSSRTLLWPWKWVTVTVTGMKVHRSIMLILITQIITWGTQTLSWPTMQDSYPCSIR